MYIQKIIYDVSCNLSADSYRRSSSASGESLFDITKNYFYIVQENDEQNNTTPIVSERNDIQD